MVIKRVKLAETTDCHKNNMNRAVYKFMLVGIALFLLMAFYFYISIVEVTGDVVNVFFVSLVAFCIYSIFLLVTKLSSIKLSIYLVWALGLFATDIYVKDVKTLSGVNSLAYRSGKSIVQAPEFKKEPKKIKVEEKEIAKEMVWIT